MTATRPHSPINHKSTTVRGGRDVNANAGAGSVGAGAGNVSAGAGNGAATAGNGAATAGNDAATAGNVGSNAGNVGATAGNGGGTGNGGAGAGSGAAGRLMHGAGCAAAAFGALLVGVGGTLAVPAAAAVAAPAPCEQAESYAGQSGAQILRLDRLSPQPLARSSDGSAGDGVSSKAARGSGLTGAAEGDGPGKGEGPGRIVKGSDADAGTGAGNGTGKGSGVGERSGGEGSSVGDGSGGGKDRQPAGAGKDRRPTGGGEGDKATGGDKGNASNGGGRGLSKPITLGEAKSAMIARARVNAAAVTRLLDADGLDEPTIQSAPPNSNDPARRIITNRKVGPFALDKSTLTSRARWTAGMSCGHEGGNVTRAEVEVAGLGVGGALVRVPGKVMGLSTTKLDPGARTVTAAAFGARTIELLDGKVKVRVVRPPSLVASMSSKDGGEVRYLPPILEVSGRDVEATTLDTVGDHFEITLGDRPRGKKTESETEAGTLLQTGTPLPLPVVPGLPPLADESESESAQASASGTRLRITLGDVRQARDDHSIAARATAIKIFLTQPRTYADRDGTVLDLKLGVLEAAAVAPGNAAGGGAGVNGAGGLPITGPRVDTLAIAGAGLLALGTAAILLTLRRRNRGRP